MASNLLYKTKSGDNVDRDMDEMGTRQSSQNVRSTISKTENKKVSLDEEAQFAAKFQQQHHPQRWGKGIINYLFEMY